MTKSKKMTIEDLAELTINAFSHVESRFSGLEGVVTDFRAEVNERFEHMDHRFDTIEKILFHNHENRITHLEDDMRMIKTDLGK